jgi:protein MpaA
MVLHEDYEGIGAYLYELNDSLDPGLGAKIIAAMGLHVPIDLRPEIEEGVARGGIISRRDLIGKLGRLEDRPEWAEAIYLMVHHTDVSFTVETPKPFPIEARVKAHIAAVETLVNALKGKIDPLRG